MMADKDIAGVIACLADRIDVWHVAAPDLPRAASADSLADIIRHCGGHTEIKTYATIPLAWKAACESAGENDRILAFGSFHTVAEVMAARER